MVRIFETVTVIFFIGLIALLLIGITDPFHQHAKNRNTLRREHLQSIMNDIAAHVDPETKILPAGIGLEPYQIGTSIDGCAMSNSACTILADQCLNLQAITQSPEYSMPSDIQTGSLYKTSYMVTMENSDTVKLVACTAENGEEIVETRTFPGLNKYAESTPEIK